MVRLDRLYIPGQPQHVVMHSRDGQRAFIDEQDYHLFLDTLRDAAQTYEVSIHAWVLLPTGLQLLVTPSTEAALSFMMQAVGRRYVAIFNRRHGRHGGLWEGRYRSTVIEPERYCLLATQLIELAPVRAGLVAEPHAYRWSSFRHHAGLTRNPIVTDHALFWALGNAPFERQYAWQQLCSKALDEREVGVLMEATHKGWVAGGDAYRTWAAGTANRRIAPLSRGRPRRQVATDPKAEASIQQSQTRTMPPRHGAAESQ